ncbi:hypothetical protein [Amorphus sp. MBR-141]
MTVKLTDRDREVLDDLAHACRTHEEVSGSPWVKPMDCGGHNGSDHSYRLSKLVRAGLAERRPGGGYSKTAWKYRITDAGLDELKNGDDTNA